MNCASSRHDMSPKLKSKAPADAAAARAAALARYSTTSVPRTAPSAPGASEIEASQPATATRQPDAFSPVDVADSVAATASERCDAAHGWTTEAPLNDAASHTASSLQSVRTSIVTILPTTHAWERMATRDVTVAELKSARKHGVLEIRRDGCRIYTHQGVAYLVAEDGKTAVTCWRTQLSDKGMRDKGRAWGQVMTRFASDDRARRIIGPAGAMIKAMEAQLGVRMVVMPTGHVQVQGLESGVDHAMAMIDDLLDGDGKATEAQLANHLRLANRGSDGQIRTTGKKVFTPLSSELHIDSCPEDLVGRIIGKGGVGLREIEATAGVSIVYQKEHGRFCIRGDPGQQRYAAKLIQARQNPESQGYAGFVDVPKGAVGRIIGKGGDSIKAIKKRSGALRIEFSPVDLPGQLGMQPREQSRCLILATSQADAVRAACQVLRAMPVQSDESQRTVASRLEDWAEMSMALSEVPRKELMAVPNTMRDHVRAAHQRRFADGAVERTPTPAGDAPANLAALVFEVWVWRWAVDDSACLREPKGDYGVRPN